MSTSATNILQITPTAGHYV